MDRYCASTVRLKKWIVHVGQVRMYVNACFISPALISYQLNNIGMSHLENIDTCWLLPTIDSRVYYTYHFFFLTQGTFYFVTPTNTFATAKFTRILWRAAAKRAWAPRADMFVVLRRSIEQIS